LIPVGGTLTASVYGASQFCNGTVSATTSPAGNSLCSQLPYPSSFGYEAVGYPFLYCVASPSSSDDESGLSDGAIAGAVVGGIVGGALVIGGGMYATGMIGGGTTKATLASQAH